MISDKEALSEMLARLDALPWDLNHKRGKRDRGASSFQVPHQLMLKMLPKRLHPSVMEKTCLIKLFRDNAHKLNAKKLSCVLKQFTTEFGVTAAAPPKASIELSHFMHIQTSVSHCDGLLRLMDVARCRCVLTVTNVHQLGFKSVDEIMGQWFMLKHRHPFNQLNSKQHVIDDLTAGYQSINGKLLVTAAEVERLLAGESTWMIAIRCQQLGLFDLAAYWAQQSDPDKFPVKTPITNNGAGSCGNHSKERQLPFYLDNQLPHGATVSSDKISFKNGRYLCFDWYQSEWTGIIDLKNMLMDAMTLAEKHTKSVIECSFFDLCVTLGFERALDKLLFAAQADQSYPGGVIPVFDLDAITPESQAKALSIHLATGNFTKHIVEFKNACEVLRIPKRLKRADRDSALSLRFSQRDLCLLQLTLFNKFDCLENFQKTLKETKLFLKQTDIELLRTSKPDKNDIFDNFNNDSWQTV